MQLPVSSLHAFDSTRWVGWLIVSAVACVAVGLPSEGVAQSSAEQEVRRLVDEATDHYDTLEIQKAEEKLKRAIKTGESEDVSPSTLAKAYVILGVVQYGATKDEETARKAFIAALKHDADTSIPSVYQTPTLTDLMEEARDQAGPFDQDEGAGEGGEGREVDEFTHEVISTADAGEPLEVEAFVPRSMSVSTVEVVFRRYEESEWHRVELEAENATRFAAEIEGDRIYTSQINYYLEARDQNDEVVARSGSESESHTITVLGTSSYDPDGAGETETTEEDSETDETDEGTGGGTSGGDDGKGEDETDPSGGSSGFVEVGLGTGFGFLPGGTPTANPDRDVEPGFASTFAHTVVSGGAVLGPHSELGLYIRWQFTPAQDFDAIVAQNGPARYTGFQNGECLGTGIPGDCLLGLKYRYTFTGGPVKLFSTVGGGFGRARHWLRLKTRATRPFCRGKPVYTDAPQPYCYRRDTVRPGWLHFGAGGGVGYQLSSQIALLGEAYLEVFFPDTAVNLDLTVGPQFRF